MFVNKSICWYICETWGSGEGLLPWYEGGTGSGMPRASWALWGYSRIGGRETGQASEDWATQGL